MEQMFKLIAIFFQKIKEFKLNKNKKINKFKQFLFFNKTKLKDLFHVIIFKKIILKYKKTRFKTYKFKNKSKLKRLLLSI